MRPGQSRNRPKDFLHGRRGADNFWSFLWKNRHRFPLPAEMLDLRAGPADPVDSLVHIKRLRKVLKGSPMEGRDRAFKIRMRRHDNDRQLRTALLETF